MSLDRMREGRDFETRQHDNIMFGRADTAHFDIFYNFPKHKMPPFMIYVWANFDSKNLTKLCERGYRFVPPARHPEYIAHQFGAMNETPRYIFKGKQVLMEISEELYNRNRQAKINKHQQSFRDQEKLNKHKKPNLLGFQAQF
jgi:hypothetical protein